MNQALPTADLRRAVRVHHAHFETLYREHHAFVWRCARRLGVPDAELEDVLQDVFVIAYRRIDQLEQAEADGTKASTWLFGVLRNVLRNRSRGHQRRQRRQQAFAEHVRVEEHGRHRRERSLPERALAEGALSSFLRELPRAQREVFVLIELEGHSGREVAELLGIKTNTAHSRLRLARRAFARHFELEPKREQIAAAVAPLRTAAPKPPHEVQARAYGLILLSASAATTRRGGGLALGSWLSGKLSASLVAVGVVAGVAGGGAALAAKTEDRATLEQGVTARAAPAGSTAQPRARQQEQAVTEKPALVPAPIEVSAGTSSERAREPKARPSEPRPKPAEQLGAARRALVEGQPEKSLALLDAIPDREPKLLDHRVATRVAALCRLGRSEEARASVEALRRRQPASPLLVRIEHACW